MHTGNYIRFFFFSFYFASEFLETKLLTTIVLYSIVNHIKSINFLFLIDHELNYKTADPRDGER